MNSRFATLSEGIANNALLMAFGVTEVSQLPDEDLRIGALLGLLQDDAKNESSWLTWREGAAQVEVAAKLRRDFLVTADRADNLSGSWGRHPLLGRMSLPAYRAGTEKVAELRSPPASGAGPAGALRLCRAGGRRDHRRGGGVRLNPPGRAATSDNRSARRRWALIGAGRSARTRAKT